MWAIKISLWGAHMATRVFVGILAPANATQMQILTCLVMQECVALCGIICNLRKLQ